MQDRFRSRFFHKPSGKYLNSQSLVYCNGCYEQVADRQSPKGTYHAYILATYNTSEIIEEQCTGVKDESEDLIYENDIVELDDGTELVNAVIEWDNNAGCWNIRTSDTIYTFDNLYGNEMRVIGNIHENPDLLENKDGSFNT
jgi:uncharacterized phage protein (TIGR01671 family)